VAFVRFILGIACCTLLAFNNAYAVDTPLLSFGDLLKHPIGPNGLEIAPNAKSMQGHNVRMRGFMVKSEEDSMASSTSRLCQSR